MKNFCYYLLLFIFVSCNNEVKTTVNHKKSDINKLHFSSKDTLENQKEEIPKDLIDFLIYRRIKIKDEIKNLDKNACTDLYVLYKKETDSVVQILSNKKENFEIQDNYYSIFYDSEGKAKKLSKSLKDKIKRFENAKLELWNVGEGLAELRTVPDFYTSLFEHKLNPDFDEYIHLTAKDEAILYAADAGLIISHKDLGGRVLQWEKFIQKYPKSKLRIEVLETYKYYQQNYIIGLDNTPFWDYESKELYPQAKEEFLRFIKSNPKSNTSTLISKLLEQKLTSEEVYNFLEKEQLKIK